MILECTFLVFMSSVSTIFVQIFVSESTYFYQMNRVPKDWQDELTIFALNITILRSKVQCFCPFLADSTLLPLQSSWVHPNILSNWLVGTPYSQQIVSAPDVHPAFAFKNICIDEIYLAGQYLSCLRYN